MINRMTLNIKSVKMSSLLFILCWLFSLFVSISSEIGKCGEITIKDNRIVGGTLLEYVKYPWFANLIRTDDRNSLACGGSLISNRYVLTAAHCYKPFFKNQKNGTLKLEEVYIVQLGVMNICVREEGVERFVITKVHIHNNYYKDLKYFDIALLELETEANNFMPICLPFGKYESNNRTGLIATVVGLGKEAYMAKRLPCIVHEADVEIQSDLICERMLTEHKEDGTKLHDVFCAGSGNGDKDTCQGDSGGPLQVKIDDIRYLLGVTSFGYECAKRNTYGVYTDVSHFLDWIYSITKITPPSHVVKSSIQSNSRAQQNTVPRTRQRKPARNILQQILNL